MSAPTTQKRWLPKEEAAEYLGGISMMSLRRLTESGALHVHNVVPGRAMYDVQELDEYMVSTRKPA